MTSPSRWIREGIVTGLIAYIAVAVFYFAFDLFTARGALFTVDRIGRLLLHGSAGIATTGPAVAIDLSAVIGYSAVHLVASLLIGIVVCRLVHEAELQPMLAQVALLFIVAGFAATIAGVGLLSTSIRDVLPWWSIIVANALAVLVAGLVLIRRHPEFLGRMTVAPRR
ncbi:MAG: sugar porter family MFS transporter [Gemmatimonadetes bacterium]|nr:sugar porter family MFS transporter [Gemmatimonadota bacterium]